MLLLEEFLGTWEHGKGRFLLSSGYRFACEAGVFYDRDSGKHYSVVDLPGSALAMLSSEQVVDLVRRLLSLGYKGTRADGAIDLLDGSGRHIIDDIQASCERRELCGARTWQRDEQKSGESTTLRMVTLGRRGKDGSGRYCRTYDKGLETKTAAVGEWIRWEVEFAGDCAAEMLLAVADSNDPYDTMRSYVLGAFEFRRHTGDKNVSRRPLVPWWEAFIASTRTIRAIAHRASSTLAGYTQWLRTAVAPGLVTLCKHASMSIEEVMQALIGELPSPRNDLLKRTVLCHAGAHIQRTSGEGDH